MYLHISERCSLSMIDWSQKRDPGALIKKQLKMETTTVHWYPAAGAEGLL